MLETYVTIDPYHSKVNERLAHKQFVTFLDHNDKLSQFETGNRKCHSTQTALLSVTDELLKAMDEKKISLLVLMDMSKAFDSITHDILLSKLRNLGLSRSNWRYSFPVSSTRLWCATGVHPWSCSVHCLYQ